MIHKRNFHKLFNKDFNFAPTQTNFSKTTVNKGDLEGFYRRIKLILKMPRIRTGLLKWTYLENLQTKPGFQITISIVQKHS